MNKEIINQYCEQIRNEEGHTMSFGSLRTLKLIEDSVDTLINTVKEGCAMIFEDQISDENTDEANTNLSLNAKAIRDSKE